MRVIGGEWMFGLYNPHNERRNSDYYRENGLRSALEMTDTQLPYCFLRAVNHLF